MNGRVVDLFPVPAPPADFVAFWAMYPRRESKHYTRRIWHRLPAADRRAALAALPDHVAEWQAQGREMRHIPHPSTWLNGRRWEDELESSPAAQAERIARQLSA